MGPTGAAGRWASGRGGKMKIAAELCGSVEVDSTMKERQIASRVPNVPSGASYISSLFASLTERTKRSRLVYGRGHKDAHGG